MISRGCRGITGGQVSRRSYPFHCLLVSTCEVLTDSSLYLAGCSCSLHHHSSYCWLQCVYQGKLECSDVCLVVSVSLRQWSPIAVTDTTRDIPIVFTAYVTWKYYKQTKIVDLDELPLRDAFEHAERVDEPEQQQKGWIRALSWIWD